MPGLALVLGLVWFVSLFVVRTAIQLAKTGSTGLRGFHGRVGSLPWIAGMSISLGILLALLGPLATLLAWPGQRLLFEASALHGLGAFLLLCGTAGAVGAQSSMGASWRVGVDESERTPLVTSGLFAWVRNPIFSFMGLSLVGLVLCSPNTLILVGGSLCVLGVELQVRVVEEPYLTSVHGAAYRAYAARVGRFVPGVGLLDEAEPSSASS